LIGRDRTSEEKQYHRGEEHEEEGAVQEKRARSENRLLNRRGQEKAEGGKIQEVRNAFLD